MQHRGSTPLYAVGGPDQSMSNGLYSIDPGTGTATLVGQFASSIFMAGLTYDMATDTLYGSSTGPAGCTESTGSPHKPR